MVNNKGFMAQELPEKEMEMLYKMLGKIPQKNKTSQEKRKLWNLKFIGEE